MLSLRYAFISAYLKAQESKLVTPDHMDRLLSTHTMRDALATVRETDVGSYLEEAPIDTFDDLEEYLWSYLARSYAYIESLKLLPQDMLKILSAYIVKYDVLNIKAALETIRTGKKARMIPVGVISKNGLLHELSIAESVDEVIQLLVRCGLKDYVPVLEQARTGEGPESKLLLEAGLDSEYYRKMLDTARTTRDGAVLTRALGLIIDLTNLQTVSRAIIEGIGPDAAQCTIAGGYRLTDHVIKELLNFKLTDLPDRLGDSQYQEIASEMSGHYDRTRRITAVDEVIDKHKLRMLRDLLSPRVLSPLVMAWYLVLKEVETRNLRLALKTMIDGVPVTEIKSYLVS